MPRENTMKKTVKVSTEYGDITVKKLALGEYAELMKALKNLPKELGTALNGKEAGDFDSTNNLIQILPSLVATAIPEFCALLALTSDKDEDFYIQADLLTSVKVLISALELNNYDEIVSLVKKSLGEKKKAASPKK